MQRGRPLFLGIAHRVRGREAGGACVPRWALPGPLGTVVEKKRGHLRKLGVGVGPKAGFSRIRSWGLVRALGNMPGVHGFGATCFSRIPNRCYVCEMPIVSRFKADVIQLRGPSGREGVLEARAGRCQPKSRSPLLVISSASRERQGGGEHRVSECPIPAPAYPRRGKPSVEATILNACRERVGTGRRSPLLVISSASRERQGGENTERANAPSLPPLTHGGETKCGSDYFEYVSGEGRNRASFSAPCHFER